MLETAFRPFTISVSHGDSSVSLNRMVDRARRGVEEVEKEPLNKCAAHDGFSPLAPNPITCDRIRRRNLVLPNNLSENRFPFWLVLSDCALGEILQRNVPTWGVRTEPDVSRLIEPYSCVKLSHSMVVCYVDLNLWFPP